MKTIIVLAGGISTEREVSLRSGQAVAEALESKGYRTILHDPIHGIDNLPEADAVFLALHGEGGEDGSLQADLETQGRVYVGADAAASALCFNKQAYKKLLTERDFPLANGEVVTKETIWQSPLTSQPFVLKPVDGGSSIDAHIIRDTANVPKAAIEKTLETYGDMLLEELIEGIELTVGILGDTPLQVIEIIPPAGGEFDFDNKYNGTSLELCPPEHLDQETQRQAQELSLQVHVLVGARDLSRTDMIATPDGRLVVLETNTLPGMTAESLYPKAAAASGIDMADLVDQLVKMALERKS
nr:D-ala D-ala ligase C-terminus [uncultured bacterium]